jgi:hypothetical protein
MMSVPAHSFGTRTDVLLLLSMHPLVARCLYD